VPKEKCKKANTIAKKNKGRETRRQDHHRRARRTRVNTRNKKKKITVEAEARASKPNLEPQTKKPLPKNLRKVEDQN